MQMSDDWLTGVNTDAGRILKSLGNPVETVKIEPLPSQGRLEEQGVQTDSAGEPFIFIVDSSGKITKATSTMVSTILTRVLR